MGVTRSLIALNTLIFALYFSNPNAFNYVIDNFAMTPADLSQGKELWSVLTCVFLHGSIMHLVGNMYFLHIVGDNLEDVLGYKRFFGNSWGRCKWRNCWFIWYVLNVV